MINRTLNKLTADCGPQGHGRGIPAQLELSISNSLSFDERLAMMVDAQWLAKANSRLKRLLKRS